MVSRKRRPTHRRPATSSTSPPRLKARGQLQHRARPAGADLLGPKLVHTSARPSPTTTAEKHAAAAALQPDRLAQHRRR
jgi:hypothetical protein